MRFVTIYSVFIPKNLIARLMNQIIILIVNLAMQIDVINTVW